MKRIFMAASFSSALFLSACGGGATSSNMIATPDGVKIPGIDYGDGDGGNMAIGASCASGDSDKICLAMKYVVYKDSSGKPVSNDQAAFDNLQGMNAIWAQCGIAFQIEKYEEVDPRDFGLSYGGSASAGETNAIRAAFVENNSLLSVTTGPWGTAKNAWTAMPGSGPYGAVMEGGIASGYAEIYAHEFGHYLNLDHVSGQSNTMSAVIGKDSVNLSDSECATARDTAVEYWAQMLR